MEICAVAARGQIRASKPTANTVNPAPGSASEGALAVRLTAARDAVIGLLMRDTTAAVVVRALQYVAASFCSSRSTPQLTPSPPLQGRRRHLDP